MAITQAMCTSFKAEILDEQHDLVADTLKIALFTSSANLGASTTAYSTSNEVSGTGYSAGGETLPSKAVSTTGTTTTTTVTVGTDLTVTGGDVGFGNGQDATVSVAATTSTTAGRDLTISAGSTSTNGNNIDGGDLILKSGGGDGTGTSIMTFHTKVSGTDTAAERMRIHTNGNVGINEAAPSAHLHIMQDSTSGIGLMVEEDTNSASASPDIVFFKSKGSGGSDHGADNDDLGHLKFRGRDDAGNSHDYFDMFAEIADASNGTEGGRVSFRIASTSASGAMRELLRLRSNSSGDEVVINDSHLDHVDFRVEGDTDTSLLFTNAGTDKVGIGLTSPKTKLTVEGAFTLKEQADADGDTAAYGQIWVHDDTPNTLYFTNDAGNDILLSEEVFIISLSDETSNLTTGNGKASFNMPFAMTLTGVKATVNTAPVGSTIIVDINEAGSTILSTKLSIDASELTSSSAASAAVISDASLANDALITFDIDQIGSSTAGKGLKVTLYGYRT